MSNLLQNVLNYIYPPRCPFCGEVMPTLTVCESCSPCIEKVPAIAEVLQLLPTTFVDKFYAHSLYEGDVRDAILRMKFENAHSLGAIFGQYMASVLPTQLEDAIIVPVPQSARRAKQQENTALLLAKVISEKTGIPLHTNNLYKQTETKLQHSLNKTERATNLVGAFAIKQSKALAGKTVLLCDDIVTTGATLHECAKIVKEHGAKQVFGICFAATPPGQMNTSRDSI